MRGLEVPQVSEDRGTQPALPLWDSHLVQTKYSHAETSQKSCFKCAPIAKSAPLPLKYMFNALVYLLLNTHKIQQWKYWGPVRKMRICAAKCPFRIFHQT